MINWIMESRDTIVINELLIDKFIEKQHIFSSNHLLNSVRKFFLKVSLDHGDCSNFFNK